MLICFMYRYKYVLYQNHILRPKRSVMTAHAGKEEGRSRRSAVEEQNEEMKHAPGP